MSPRPPQEMCNLHPGEYADDCMECNHARPQHWWHTANRGIIGLAPAPWNDDWPTEGYDGDLRSYEWDEPGTFERTGITREQWLELADEMIARWTAYRAHLESLPEEAT